MKASSFALYFWLYMSMLAPVAMAQEIPIPDKAHRQVMNLEEYSKFREKMRLRMERTHAQERKQPNESGDRPAKHTERIKPDSSYGEGYHSRNRSEDRPNNRPERPHVEKFNKPDRHK